MAETAERRRVAAWCPQEQVLRHHAVGCFVTHCGWNSACEGLTAGVPMVGWPVFADQFTICKYVCEVWGVGLRLDAEVRREQVAGHVNEAMESDEIRRSAARWKAEAEAAASPVESISQASLDKPFPSGQFIYHIDLSLWKHECLALLDAQDPNSVVYANFGELAEFAWGLAATSRPFLLVIREDGSGGVAAQRFRRSCSLLRRQWSGSTWRHVARRSTTPSGAS
ncbi:hypothetical protein HU200_028798 [Digitaria exilis]|uniref:UDP-glycosyltransferases domain-containing protein n=1 Tax=Digitaria exilis TaxID=1010633 RepID=A0A835ESU1_9POAL|nr:hypothetical protein HU200_028798 [Digitaria exilis]